MTARGIAAELIRRKRDGAPLSDEAISTLVAGIVDGSVSDAQIAAFAMAVYFRGMTRAECAALTRAMTRSGSVLDVAGRESVRFSTSTPPAASATR